MKNIVSLRLALQASINIAHELHDRHYDAIDRIGMSVGVCFKPPNNNKNKNNDMIAVRGLAKNGRECDGMKALQQLQLQQEQQKQKNKKLLHEQQPQQSGSLEYFRRALILQEAALSLVKEAVADRIATPTQQVTDILKLRTTNTNTNTATTNTTTTTTSRGN